MDGSSGRTTGATHRESVDNRDASCSAAAAVAAADARSGVPATSRFHGAQRRANPQALVTSVGSPVYRPPLARWKQAMLALRDRINDWRALMVMPQRRRQSQQALSGGSPTPGAQSVLFRRVVASLFARWTAWAAARPRLVVAPVRAVQKAALPAPHRLVGAGLLAVMLGAVAVLSSIGRSHQHSTAATLKRPGIAAAQLALAALAPPVVSHEQPVAPPPLPDHRLPQAPSADFLLSEVSTMDLMMPIAEPDLDIRSRHSLWAQVGKAYGIDPLLLYSVALVESKALYPDGRVAPTPWLFRVDDHLVRGDRQHVQLQMAAASQFGSAVQDVGIMQVYYPMHRDAVRDPLTLLDPRTNITVGAKILRDGMHRTRDRVMGVGYYHSRTPSLAKGYGTAVLTVYERLKTERRKSRKHDAVAR